MSKKNYLCILRSDHQGGCKEPSGSTADMEAMFAKYQQWQEQFSDNILDMGRKLLDGGAIVRQSDVNDGPFVEVKEIIGGYMMLQADSLEEAVAAIKASPMVQNPGVSIEIRETSAP